MIKKVTLHGLNILLLLYMQTPKHTHLKFIQMEVSYSSTGLFSISFGYFSISSFEGSLLLHTLPNVRTQYLNN